MSCDYLAVSTWVFLQACQTIVVNVVHMVFSDIKNIQYVSLTIKGQCLSRCIKFSLEMSLVSSSQLFKHVKINEIYGNCKIITNFTKFV